MDQILKAYLYFVFCVIPCSDQGLLLAWLCTHSEITPGGTQGDKIECLGSNLCWPCTKQILDPLFYHSVPLVL